MTHRAPTSIGPDDDSWTKRYDARDALLDALAALNGSQRTLDKGASLMADRAIVARLSEMKERRVSATRKLIDLGLCAGFGVDDDESREAERLHRAWMSLKSRVTDDQSVLSVIVDEEKDARDTLVESLGRGLTRPIERTLRASIATIYDDLNRLRPLAGE